jgi:hypothetical protein
MALNGTTTSPEAPPLSFPLRRAEYDTIVARLAYALYCQRGGAPGHDLDDWLQAERVVQQALDQQLTPEDLLSPN